MQTATPEAVRPARLVLLWFGVQLAWGAIIGISLQARCAAFNPSHPLDAFAYVSIPGAIAAGVTQLILGFASDRFRRRGDKRLWFYAIGSLTGALGIVALYLAPSLTALLFAYVVVQIAVNVVIGPFQAIIPDFVEPARIGVASGWMAAMQSGGNAVGAVLATVLGSTPLLGVAIALILVASAGISILYARGLALQPIRGEQRLSATGSLADLFISRAFVYLGFYTLVGYLYFYVATILPSHFIFDATTASGICVLIFTLVGALGAALAARPSDRLDERLVVCIGGAAIAGGVLAMAFLPMLVVVPIAIVIAGIGWGVFLCADWAFACRVLPNGALAGAMAIWNIAVVGPQMVVPILVTAVLARLGTLHSASGPKDAFMLAAGEILLGAAWIWRLPKRPGGK